jgi:hypothetical protein
MRTIIGYLLITAGILMMLWGVWQSFEIFTDKKPVPELFRFSEFKNEPGNISGVSGVSTEDQVRNLIKEQLDRLLPSEFIAKTFNLISWSIFMFILIYAGSKISVVGIGLINRKKRING